MKNIGSALAEEPKVLEEVRPDWTEVRDRRPEPTYPAAGPGLIIMLPGLVGFVTLLAVVTILFKP